MSTTASLAALFAALIFLTSRGQSTSTCGDDSIGAQARTAELSSDKSGTVDLSDVIGKEPTVLEFNRGTGDRSATNSSANCQ